MPRQSQRCPMPRPSGPVVRSGFARHGPVLETSASLMSANAVSANAVSAGRHWWVATTPGSTGSRPANAHATALMISGPRGATVYVKADARDQAAILMAPTGPEIRLGREPGDTHRCRPNSSSPARGR